MRPVTIEVRFEMGYVAECAAREEIGETEKVAVPSAVLEHREHAVQALRERCDLPRALERRRHRLLDHDMFTRSQRHRRNRDMSVVRCRDHHELHRRQRAGFFRRRDDRDAGQVGADAFGTAGADDRQLETRRRTNQRRVKNSTRVAVADQRDTDHIQLTSVASARVSARPRG